VGRRLAVPVHAEGILSQFDGYQRLLELDWAGYLDRYGNIGRLDLVLESENDSTNRYKLAKQPDVVTLVNLLGQDGLREQQARLGYPFSQDDLVRTVTYYLERTSNGFTLSRVVNASASHHDSRQNCAESASSSPTAGTGSTWTWTIKPCACIS